MKLKLLSSQTGGRDLLVKTVERHYIAGSDHLVDQELTKKVDGMSNCCCFFILTIFLAAVGFMIRCSVLYYSREK